MLGSIRIKITLISVFVVLTGLMALLLLGEGMFFGGRLADTASHRLMREISAKVSTRVLFGSTRVDDMIGLLEQSTTLRVAPMLGTEHPALPLFVKALSANPELYALYTGNGDGDFFEVINVSAYPSFAALKQLPAGVQWAVVTIDATTRSQGLRVWEYFDSAFRLVRRDEETSDYDPRKRPWYGQAMTDGGIIKTDPYVYSSIKQPGITFAKAIDPATRTVLGVDITMNTLSRFLGGQKVTDNSTAFLFNDKGIITAFPDEGRMLKSVDDGKGGQKLSLAQVSELFAWFDMAFARDASDEPTIRSVTPPAGEMLLGVSRVQRSGKGAGEYFAMIVPEAEVKRELRTLGMYALLSALLSISVFVPVIWVISGKIAQPIQALVDETRKIQAMDLDNVREVSTRIVELSHLSGAFVRMAGSVKDYRAEILHKQDQLEKLVEYGLALVAEKDEEKLLDMILQGAKKMANADGGTLYIRTKDDTLAFQLVHNDTLGMAFGGAAGTPNLPAVRLFGAEDGRENHANVVSHAVLTEKTVNIEDVYNSRDFDFTGTRKFDEGNGYRTQSVLTVPLNPRGAKVVGALQLINARDENGAIVPFSKEVQGFVEGVAAQAAVAIDNKNLVLAQAVLIDSIVEILANAIDAKSPYTGGHCQRVPELTTILAQAAHDAESGPFADFRLDGKDKWRELHLGALLHDCGKVTTPEYVVDKATKLETIYNRIHEVRMRFEVLRRDAEIAYLQGRLDGGETEALRRELDAEIARLTDDFAFIATCNVGGEFMADESLERLAQISERTWTRHFDDRLGLSQMEELRLVDVPPVSAPAEERLLADKPQHILPRVD
ncbi:MAG: GAF domain-containing protein, partial [Alphaproteobacteria bacterium]|nr:GAF domain-containing protein [Alphaproteobacteria bacterium]